jgi:vacuole morphology and inheritance protein 14
MGVEDVYRSISEILTDQPLHPAFARKLVKTMELLLFTDEGFEDVRNRLKFCLKNEDGPMLEFFQILFKAWCINPVSAIALSLITNCYKLTYSILGIVSLGFISKDILVDLSLLVQLLESPVFVHLRMQTLEYD